MFSLLSFGHVLRASFYFSVGNGPPSYSAAQHMVEPKKENLAYTGDDQRFNWAQGGEQHGPKKSKVVHLCLFIALWYRYSETYTTFFCHCDICPVFALLWFYMEETLAGMRSAWTGRMLLNRQHLWAVRKLISDMCIQSFLFFVFLCFSLLLFCLIFFLAAACWADISRCNIFFFLHEEGFFQMKFKQRQF